MLLYPLSQLAQFMVRDNAPRRGNPVDVAGDDRALPAQLIDLAIVIDAHLRKTAIHIRPVTIGFPGLLDAPAQGNDAPTHNTDHDQLDEGAEIISNPEKCGKQGTHQRKGNHLFMTPAGAPAITQHLELGMGTNVDDVLRAVTGALSGWINLAKLDVRLTPPPCSSQTTAPDTSAKLASKQGVGEGAVQEGALTPA